MKGILAEIASMVKDFGSAPTFAEMPRKTLADKGIAGPTAAHTIEEVHTPLNLAYLTFTTGSSAFQNIVGITFAELPARVKASFTVLERAGLKAGDKVLVTYPPLVNVFSGEAFKKYGLQWEFLVRSSRDAFLAALTAGTPLDLELLPIAQEVLNAEVHDLYGCQEFGWLCMDGVPVRDDVELVKLPDNGGQDMYELVVGGLPMGDSFPVSESGHVCNRDGKVITYRRERTYPEYEVIVKATTLTSTVTLGRVARSILRIKGRVVKISPDVVTGAEHTVLELIPDYITAGKQQGIIIEGPEKTRFFDDLVQAQLDYQQKAKADPTWTKRN